MQGIKALTKATKSTQTNGSKNCTTVDNTVLLDKEITPTVFRLYCILNMLAGNKNQVCVRIKKLAELLGRSTRTVLADMTTITNKGLIERVHRTSPEDGNLPNLFIIHDRIRDNLRDQ